jgi:hypothetical protein
MISAKIEMRQPPLGAAKGHGAPGKILGATFLLRCDANHKAIETV